MSEAPSQRREYSKDFLLWIAVALLFAAIFGGIALVYATLHQKEQADALSAKEQYDESFLLAMRGQIEQQATIIASLRSSLSPIVASSIADNLRDILTALAEIDRSNRQTAAILGEWHSTSVALNPTRLTLNVSPMGAAYAAEQKQKKMDKQPPPANVGMPGPPLIPPPQPESHESKLKALKPFLWAFIVVPLLFGYGAFRNVNSQNTRTQDFAFATIAAVLGYYFGLGSGAFAVAFG